MSNTQAVTTFGGRVLEEAWVPISKAKNLSNGKISKDQNLENIFLKQIN